MTFAVLIMGHALSGKTSLAYRIAPALGAAVVSTSTLGHFVPNRTARDFFTLRDARYQRALSVVDVYLKQHASIIADGTYALSRWRREFFKLVKRHGVRDIAIVLCECRHEGEISRRLRRRAANPHLPDAAAATADTYSGSVSELEPFESAEVPNDIRLGVVRYDSYLSAVDVSLRSPLAEHVAEVLRGLPAASFSQGLPFLISLEGIGGSGKTTQFGRLRARYREDSRYSFQPELSPEHLGRWLETSRQGGLRVLPTASSSLAVHGLIACDWVFEMVARKAAVQYVVQDTGRYSRLSHLMALPDHSLTDTDRHQLLTAFDAATEQIVSGLFAGYATIYFECPIDLAISRLEKRHGNLGETERDFVRRLHEAYGRILSGRPNVASIDASDSEERVALAVDDCLTRLGIL